MVETSSVISKVLPSLAFQEEVLPHLRRALGGLPPTVSCLTSHTVPGLPSPQCWAWAVTIAADLDGETRQGPGAAGTSEGFSGPHILP